MYSTKSTITFVYSYIGTLLFITAAIVVTSIVTPQPGQEQLQPITYSSFTVLGLLVLFLGVRFFALYRYILQAIESEQLLIYDRRQRVEHTVALSEIQCTRFAPFDNAYRIQLIDGTRYYLMFGVYREPNSVKKRFEDLVVNAGSARC